jgi:hypothetical protein
MAELHDIAKLLTLNKESRKKEDGTRLSGPVS